MTASHGTADRTAPRTDPPVLDVQDLVTHFTTRAGFGRKATVRAVDGVSFQVPADRTLGLVGESGCGKTTTGRTIMRLVEPTSGRILLHGEDVTGASSGRLRDLRAAMQFVFQDPYSSLNARMTVREILAEPLRAHDRWDSSGPAVVERMLDTVGMPASAADRYPHEFSGGQRQRIGIARSLALEPRLLVLDEPVSALDVSIQAQVLNLLLELQRAQQMAFLFISHDLSVVKHMSDDVAVMYLGVIVETGPADVVLEAPAHPYTKALASAVPVSHPDDRRERIVLRGDVPSPIDPPTGCRFRTRCWKADDVCASVPPLRAYAGRMVACHHPEPVEITLRDDGLPQEGR